MKKTIKVVDLDCANCAQKMEDAIRKIKGVQDVTVSFMAQKITLTADDAAVMRLSRKWSRSASGLSRIVSL